LPAEPAPEAPSDVGDTRVRPQGSAKRARQSAAASAGVQPGDVLLSVNGRPVNSIGDVRDVVSKSDKSVALQIFDLPNPEGWKAYEKANALLLRALDAALEKP